MFKNQSIAPQMWMVIITGTQLVVVDYLGISKACRWPSNAVVRNGLYFAGPQTPHLAFATWLCVLVHWVREQPAMGGSEKHPRQSKRVASVLGVTGTIRTKYTARFYSHMYQSILHSPLPCDYNLQSTFTLRFIYSSQPLCDVRHRPVFREHWGSARAGHLPQDPCFSW